MKSRVRVTVLARAVVEMFVEHAPDEEATDLTDAEEQRAIGKAEIDLMNNIEVDRVELIEESEPLKPFEVAP